MKVVDDIKPYIRQQLVLKSHGKIPPPAPAADESMASMLSRLIEAINSLRAVPGTAQEKEEQAGAFKKWKKLKIEINRDSRDFMTTVDVERVE